jgi:hypothetical protein
MSRATARRQRALIIGGATFPGAGQLLAKVDNFCSQLVIGFRQGAVDDFPCRKLAKFTGRDTCAECAEDTC